MNPGSSFLRGCLEAMGFGARLFLLGGFGFGCRASLLQRNSELFGTRVMELWV